MRLNLSQITVSLYSSQLHGSDKLRHQSFVHRVQLIQLPVTFIFHSGKINSFDQIINNSLQTKADAIFWRVYFLNSITLQFLCFLRQNHSAAERAY